MNFSRIGPAIKTIMLLTLILMPAFAWAAEKKAPGDKVAVVNGVTINQGTYDRELNFFVRRAATGGKQIPDAQMAQMKNEVLESLIDRELLFQESKKKGIQVKSEAVSDQLQKIKQRYPNQEEFKKLLSSMGLTESDVLSQIARGMAIQELIDKEVAEKIKVSDEETKSFYDRNPQLFQQPEQVKASHILIKVQSNAPDEQKAEDIVETQFGYHLIKVNDKKPAKKMAYAEVKDRLSEHLKKQKTDSETNAYIETLRKDAKIEKFL